MQARVQGLAAGLVSKRVRPVPLHKLHVKHGAASRQVRLKAVPPATQVASLDPAPFDNELEWESACQQRVQQSRRLLGHLAAVSQPSTPGTRAAELEQQGVIPVVRLTPPAAWSLMEQTIVSQAMAGGCPAAALRTFITPEHVTAPTVPGPTGHQNKGNCLLSRCSQGAVFQSPEINDFLMQMFAAVTTAWATHHRIPQVHISRFDLFHAHLLLAPVTPPPSRDTGTLHTVLPVQQPTTQEGEPCPPMGLALLFHCKEYPAYCPEQFPYVLGWCQEGSTLVHQPDSFDLRNVLWYQDQLAFLDAGVGSPLHGLLWPGTQPLRTIYEGDLGVALADINLLLRYDELLGRSTSPGRDCTPASLAGSNTAVGAPSVETKLPAGKRLHASTVPAPPAPPAPSTVPAPPAPPAPSTVPAPPAPLPLAVSSRATCVHEPTQGVDEHQSATPPAPAQVRGSPFQQLHVPSPAQLSNHVQQLAQQVFARLCTAVRQHIPGLNLDVWSKPTGLRKVGAKAGAGYDGAPVAGGGHVSRTLLASPQPPPPPQPLRIPRTGLVDGSERNTTCLDGSSGNSHEVGLAVAEQQQSWWQGQLMYELPTGAAVSEQDDSSEHGVTAAGLLDADHTLQSQTEQDDGASVQFTNVAWSSTCHKPRVPAASHAVSSQHVADLRDIAVLLVCCNESAQVDI